MTTCPKCNCTSIAGPRYVKKIWGREALSYQCNRCGYIKETPTRDALARDTVQPLVKP